MKCIPVFLIMLFLGCHSSMNVMEEPERTELGFLFEDQRPFDGCDSHIRLYTFNSQSSGNLLKPTPATAPILAKALADIPANPDSSERAVTVRFIGTGNQVDLECGWGSRQKATEIQILSIVKR